MVVQSTPADLAWPILHVDLETALIRQDREHIAGAGALFVFWRGPRPVGQIFLPPFAALPGTQDILEQGRRLPPIDPEPSATRGRRTLSVIIPTRDRPRDLARCLAAFAEQTLQPHQIVVVDNASDAAATLSVVADFSSVTHVHEPRPGLDYARNKGLAAATGQIVAFCDDDVVLTPNWCERMVAAFDDPNIEAVTGLVLPLELATEAQRLFEWKWPFGRGFSRRDFGPSFMLANRLFGCPASEVGAGASMGFRREIFDRVGLYDLRLGAGASGCSDDSEMWYRIMAMGGTCRYDPSIVAFHRHRETMAGLRKQIHDYVQGNVVSHFIQFERFGHWGNLSRIGLRMPYQYLRRAIRMALGRRRVQDVGFKDELQGYFAGLAYYAKHARTPSGVERDGSARARST